MVNLDVGGNNILCYDQTFYKSTVPNKAGNLSHEYT